MPWPPKGHWVTRFISPGPKHRGRSRAVDNHSGHCPGRPGHSRRSEMCGQYVADRVGQGNLAWPRTSCVTLGTLFNLSGFPSTAWETVGPTSSCSGQCPARSQSPACPHTSSGLSPGHGHHACPHSEAHIAPHGSSCTDSHVEADPADMHQWLTAPARDSRAHVTA